MHLRTITLACSLATLLAGCAIPRRSEPPAPVTTAAVSDAAPAPAAAASAAESAVAPVVVVAHEDPANALANERSVFFDYDDFNVKAEFAAMVERHGRYLATHPAVNVRVEGHTDERGSTEYNLALGQKRAQSVVAALRRHGARDVQMEALSWGKERPRNTASNEAAWAENRRVDIVYPGNGSKPGR